MSVCLSLCLPGPLSLPKGPGSWKQEQGQAEAEERTETGAGGSPGGPELGAGAPPCSPAWLAHLLMEETLGTVSLSQMPSARSRSRISQANIVGFCRLYSAILSTTLGVATLGLEPPITPGLMLPVS